ncbi:MAG: hypothetical protein ACXWL2_04230 [Candidatus Chromulinivorax sp.]
MDTFRVFNQDFLDTGIKYAGKVSNKYKQQSYFPIGTSVQEAVDMIQKGIKKSQLIEIAQDVNDAAFKGLVITDKKSRKFQILIETVSGKTQFYPLGK